jgi:hypothetical protein
MRMVLRLIATGDDDRCLSTDLVEICRPEGLGNNASLFDLPEAGSFWQAFNERWFWGRSTAMGRVAGCIFEV